MALFASPAGPKFRSCIKLAVLIRTDNTLKTIPANNIMLDLDGLSQLVGGHVEVVKLESDPDHNLYVNEDAKMLAYPINKIASIMKYSNSPTIDYWNFIAGDVVYAMPWEVDLY